MNFHERGVSTKERSEEHSVPVLWNQKEPEVRVKRFVENKYVSTGFKSNYKISNRITCVK